MKEIKKSTIALMVAGIVIGLICLVHNTFMIARFAGGNNPGDPYEHQEIAADLGSSGETVTLKGRARYSPYVETGSMMEVYRIEDDAFYMLYSNDPKFFNNVRYNDFFEVTGVILDRTEEIELSDRTLTVPVVEVQEMRTGDYIEIIDPTLETVEVDQVFEKENIRIQIDKIEYAEKGTRIYATFYNRSKENAYCSFNYDVDVLQGSTKYKPADSEYFWDYEWQSYLNPGEKSSGVMFLTEPLDPEQPIGLCFAVGSNAFENYQEIFTFRISGIEKTETDTESETPESTPDDSAEPSQSSDEDPVSA